MYTLNSSFVKYENGFSKCSQVFPLALLMEKFAYKLITYSTVCLHICQQFVCAKKLLPALLRTNIKLREKVCIHDTIAHKLHCAHNIIICIDCLQAFLTTNIKLRKYVCTYIAPLVYKLKSNRYQFSEHLI